METKEREKPNTRPRRANSGKSVERLEVKFGGKKYDIQFTRTGKKKINFMHDMHKLAVDVTFIQMISKKVTKKHRKRALATMYKEYTQLEDMNLMVALDPDSLTISHKKESLWAITE